MNYHVDFETFSKADLKTFGAYRYAEDPTTEILLCAIAREDEPPVLWSVTGQPDKPKAVQILKELSEDPNAVLYAHNAQFEAAIAKHLWEKTFNLPCPKLDQWRCTAAMARRAAIPSSLEECAKFLGLKQQKDKTGKDLIKLFSVPQKPTKKQPLERILPKDDPEAFHKFGVYCKQDVLVEREVHKKLAVFELKGETLEAFQFDARMNDRGVPVNVDALEKAQVIVEEFDGRVTSKFRWMTGLNPTQGKAFQVWLKPHGYPGKNLQAATVEKVLAEDPASIGMTQEGWNALKLKSLSGFAALKKIPTMLGAANKDGRVRGSMLWAGAERTHRWAGRTIQPQNFKRPVIKDTEALYDFICSGKADADALEMLYPSPLEAVASCIRHFIQPKPLGNFLSKVPGRFLDADFSAIEARIVLWLCGQEDSLQAFRDKKDAYIEMAVKIFGGTPDKVTKGQRFVGKQAVLLCGYQGGAEKFQMTCAGYGQNISKDDCQKAVQTYRKVNHKVTAAWKTMEKAAMDAIRNPGQKFKGTDKITFAMTSKPGFPALVMQLPSGHPLVYPNPKIVKALKKINGNEWEADEIQFDGKVAGRWTRVGTYGGKLLENATQAVAGDVMTHGALEADRQGFKIFMLIHDQALAEWKPGLDPDDFCKALCTLPDWAGGLPLEAEGGLVPFYRKD